MVLDKMKKQLGGVAEKVSEQAVELGGKADKDIDKSEEDSFEGVSRKEVEDAEEFASRIMRHAASLNGVKIDRVKFLRTEIKKHAPYADVDLVVERGPAAAGVKPEDVDRMAISAIDFETKKCAGLSFLAGIPGGVALLGTVPADTTQYFAHIMRIEQKLAYLYGWQSFLNAEDEVDDETVMMLVSFMGVMLQVGGAATGITKFATNVAQQGVAKSIQKQALTKTTFYPIMKKVLAFVGVKMTKETFAKTVSKIVPVVGGAVSGGMTYLAYKPSAERLRRYLRTLPTSGIPAGCSDVSLEKSFDLDEAIGVAGEKAYVAGTMAKDAAQAVGVKASEAAKGLFRPVKKK